MQHLNWQYPTWYLLFCVAAGVLAAVLLYRRDTTFSDQSPLLRYIMAFLRGLVVTVLCSLLLSPLLKLMESRAEPPVIVIAQDQSLSVRSALAGPDSSKYFKSLLAIDASFIFFLLINEIRTDGSPAVTTIATVAVKLLSMDHWPCHSGPQDFARNSEIKAPIKPAANSTLNNLEPR